jgi:YD repeat-containing protein
MMTVSFAAWLQRVLVLVLGLVLFGTTGVYADQAQYIYDDLGRLSQVIDGQGNVATYNYDAVGNLLSITRNTGGVGAPTITALTPNTGNAGASVNISLAGTNLTGAALATDNPGILVRNVLTTPTSLTATFQISFAARTGATAVTVTTTTGSAATSFSVNASAPVVSALSPTTGPVTRLVTLTGNGFSSTAALNQIRFNGVLATTLSATATSLTTQVPSGATTRPVTVTVGGSASNGVNFTVANAGPPPTLTSLLPNVGSVQGGQRTTLTGTGFIAGTTVKIGNKPASVLVQIPGGGGKVSKEISTRVNEGDDANGIALHAVDHTIVSHKQFPERGILIFRYDTA